MSSEEILLWSKGGDPTEEMTEGKKGAEKKHARQRRRNEQACPLGGRGRGSKAGRIPEGKKRPKKYSGKLEEF